MLLPSHHRMLTAAAPIRIAHLQKDRSDRAGVPGLLCGRRSALFCCCFPPLEDGQSKIPGEGGQNPLITEKHHSREASAPPLQSHCCIIKQLHLSQSDFSVESQRNCSLGVSAHGFYRRHLFFSSSSFLLLCCLCSNVGR